ncbi:MAG: non-canonical purine NTP diphosphatase [Cellulophaga sp.]|nr:non-canonical purine NTP diphosphatase [Cellulophaga sp.]
MKLVFATHNQNKVREVQPLFPENIELLSLTDIGCHEEIPETSDTIKGNAILKANFVTEHYGYDCFADDTGLLVDVLDGAPGVLSARYAGKEKGSEANMNKLLNALLDKTNRKAHFKTVIALNIHKEQFLFEGKAEGEIIIEKKGSQGFGYDPIFKPDGFNETFAELSLEIKNSISHRGKAIQKLINYLNTHQ